MHASFFNQPFIQTFSADEWISLKRELSRAHDAMSVLQGTRPKRGSIAPI
jgi:hypothetical protein